METQNREVIKLRKKANFKILTRLGQIIDQAKQKAAEKAKLLDLLDKKQSEKLENLSEEELRQRLAELG